MKNLNTKIFIWIFVIVSVIIWWLVILNSGYKVTGAWNAIKLLPTVVTIDAIIWVIFTKWGWKIKIFQSWLVPFPCLEGTWKGIIKTTWKDPTTGASPAPITIYLVIRQSFLHISCVMYSEEMESASFSAEFMIDSETNIKRLAYNYISKPKEAFRERSSIHYGTVLLTIVSQPKYSLKGGYWTDRKSTGDIELQFKTRKLIESFPNT
ncbi:MAG: hypothetical protein NT030_08630 [Candidatus Saganbacteria bacterium]|nr:hypothetical protein [Candidatus Saganbacteria bacterium]